MQNERRQAYETSTNTRSNRYNQSLMSRMSSTASIRSSICSNNDRKLLCQYKQQACPKKAYERMLCREHFCAFVRMKLRQTLCELYKSPEQAFGILDPEGLGHLTLELILNSYVVGRSNLTPEEITAYFELQNIFKDGSGKLACSKFRDLFFPHMTLAGEDPVFFKGADEPPRTDAQRKKLQAEIHTRIKTLNE